MQAFCQDQCRLASSVPVQLRTDISHIISVIPTTPAPHIPPTPTRQVYLSPF